MAKRRTAAQKRATAKMIAANRARSRKRRAPSKTRRRKVRKNPATSAAQRRTYSRTARMNPKRRRRVRRNPTGLNMRTITNDLLIPAATGAVGAIANDALFHYLPLPAQLKSPGVMRYASKGVSAIAMTWLASMVVKRQTAMRLGVGALTTLTAEIARDLMTRTVPQLAPVAMEGMGVYTMGGMGYYNPALPAGGGVGNLPNLATQENMGPGMGVYTHGSEAAPDNGYNYG